jgi:hypothetical protein
VEEAPKHNTITFSFLTTTVDENSNQVTVPISEGTYGVIAIGLVAIPSKDASVTTEREVKIEGPAPSRYTIIDSTDYIFKQEFKTDGDGNIIIDLSKALSSIDAIRFYRNYFEKYTIALKTVIELPKNENYDYLITTDNIEAEWDTEYFKKNKILQFKPINYSEYNDSIYLEALGSKTTNFVQLRSQYKTVEEAYLQIKKRYESEVVSNIVDVELPVNDYYEPINFTQVITRLLEFQAGTLTPGMSHAKSLNLETEYKRLDTVNKLINSITRMYPKITIEDGEGIPYGGEQAFVSKSLD